MGLPDIMVGEMRLRIAHDAERIAALEARLLEWQLAASAVISVQQRALCALELELAELRAEQEHLPFAF